jgi:hypothetical protein
MGLHRRYVLILLRAWRPDWGAVEMTSDQLRKIIVSLLRQWGIPAHSHQWKDYEYAKRNLVKCDLNNEQYVQALHILADWVGV